MSELDTEGNTEGRPGVDAFDSAYLAGFLDGDGSIHFQDPRSSSSWLKKSTRSRP